MKNENFYKNNGFFIIKNFIPEFFANFLLEYLNTLDKTKKLNKGDLQVENSSCIYGDPCFDTLLLKSAPLIAKNINIDLTPTYSYARIYYKDAKLKPHIDRYECEHSVSLFLGGDYNSSWPFYFNCLHGSCFSVSLNIGDCIVYKGNQIRHWRENFEGNNHYQVFLHYVETQGKYGNLKFDSRPHLGLSSSDTKREF